MSYNRFTIAAVVLTLLLASADTRCSAATIPISVINHSFESPLVPMDGKSDTSSLGDDYVSALTKVPTGWQVTGPHKQSLGQLTVAPGSSFENLIKSPPDASVQTHWANRSDTYIYQTLSATLQADMQYVLRVDMGDRTDTAFPDGVQIRLGLGAAPGKSILAADHVLNLKPPDGGWSTWENVYVTGAQPTGMGQVLRIELLSAGQQVQFDNVRLEAIPIPIPEPGTLLLAAIGLLGLTWHGRRRRGR